MYCDGREDIFRSFNIIDDMRRLSFNTHKYCKHRPERFRLLISPFVIIELLISY